MYLEAYPNRYFLMSTEYEKRGLKDFKVLVQATWKMLSTKIGKVANRRDMRWKKTKSSVSDMLSKRCPLAIQVEMTGR